MSVWNDIKDFFDSIEEITLIAVDKLETFKRIIEDSNERAKVIQDMIESSSDGLLDNLIDMQNVVVTVLNSSVISGLINFFLMLSVFFIICSLLLSFFNKTYSTPLSVKEFFYKIISVGLTFNFVKIMLYISSTILLDIKTQHMITIGDSMMFFRDTAQDSSFGYFVLLWFILKVVTSILILLLMWKIATNIYKIIINTLFAMLAKSNDSTYIMFLKTIGVYTLDIPIRFISIIAIYYFMYKMGGMSFNLWYTQLATMLGLMLGMVGVGNSVQKTLLDNINK